MNFSGPVGGGGEPGDRDRRGVGADDRALLEHRAQRGEDLALDVFLLDRGLDDEVAVGERIDGRRRRDAPERRLPLAFADGVFRHLARHVAVDGGDAGLDPLLRNVVERDIEAREGAHMGDAAAHLTGADDAYPVNVHVRPLAFRAIPPNAPRRCSTAKRGAPPLPRRLSWRRRFGPERYEPHRAPRLDLAHDLLRKVCQLFAIMPLTFTTARFSGRACRARRRVPAAP